MLKFCSKAAQESQTQKTALKKEGSDSEKASALAKEKKSSFPKPDDLEQGDNDPPLGQRSSSSTLNKTAFSGSARKRTSSSGFISPRKKQASASMKAKISTPNNQRIISDFFKK